MRFTSRSKVRRNHLADNPAEIETFEARLLLTTIPTVLTPMGTFTDATPEFSWEAVDAAVSYDLWVASLETYDAILVERGITDTSFTPSSELTLGSIRTWVRANFADDTSTAWSPSVDALLASKPVVTGPIGSGPIPLNSDTTPDITWTSGNGARRFQIWVTDVTDKSVRQYNVTNLTPKLDDAGDPVLDGSGNPVLEEIRSFTIPDTNPLQIGRYRVWVRSVDMSGRISDWSDVYEFNSGPKPENLSPSAPTFQEMPLLTWDTVDRATEYEVFVAEHPFDDPILPGASYTPVYRETVTTNSFQIPDKLAKGGYVFWVRAIARPDAAPAVLGAWSTATQFNTLRPPVIIAPVATGGVVTQARPVVEWTRIDGAARYEILVRKFDTRPPFLEDKSSDTSYKFTDVIPAGDYTIWVRAVDTRGNFGDWSDPFHITASGGRPVITSPTPGETTLFPTFTWIEVSDEDVTGYEVWVSHVGVDFTFINVTVPGTSFTVSSPLDDGDYRIWVRAIFAGGSSGPWSAPVDFRGGVATNEDSADKPEVLVAKVQVELTPSMDTWTPAELPEAEMVEPAYVAVAEPTNEPASADASMDTSPLPHDLLTEIAQDCVDAEWWDAAEKTA